MYLEEIRCKKNGKVYTTKLIRETFREAGKVKHRTLCNVSKLPEKQLLDLKKSLSGATGDFSVADLSIGRTYEYGASFSLKSLAIQIGLDKAIFSTKTQWREDVLAMICGRIMYQGSKLSLINTFNDSALWELAGHDFGVRPDVKKNCYEPMDELLKRKKKIERKFAKEKLSSGSIVLYDMTNTWLEGDYINSNLVSYGKPKGGKKGYKQVALGLLTNDEGCPVSVEIFKGSTSDQTTVLDQVKKISDEYGVTNAVFVGDRGMLTQKRIDELKETDFKVITALTHGELRRLIDKERLQMDLFDQTRITEVVDSEDNEMRYMLCKNDREMEKEGKTRQKMIEKVVNLLTTKAAVKRKRDPQKVCASVGRIFEKCKIEKFFNWSVGVGGELAWELKQDSVEKEQELDGCYVIKTDAQKGVLSKETTVNTYRNLQKVEQAFRNMKTVMLELRPIFHKSDERIESHIFIVMLSYYLQWHAMQKLKPLFELDGLGADKRWTFEGVINRLKSISKVESTVNDVPVKTSVSKPDSEQQQILDLLEVKIK